MKSLWFVVEHKSNTEKLFSPMTNEFLKRQTTNDKLHTLSKKSRLLVLISVITFIKIIIVVFFIHSIKLFEVNDVAISMLKTGKMSYVSAAGQIYYDYQFPVYPFFIYLIYFLFGIHYKLVILFNLFLSSLTVYFFYFVLKNFFNGIEKLKKHINIILFLSVLTLLVDPEITYYTIKNIHPFAIDLFLSIFSLYMMFKYIKKPCTTNLIFYSFTLGIAVLDRTTLICTTFPFVILVLKNESFKRIFKIFIICFSIASLPSATWMLRNHNLTKTFSLNSSTYKNLFIGTIEESDGTAYLPNGKNYYSVFSKKEFDDFQKMTTQEQINFYKSKYLKKLRNKPISVIKMFFIKLKNFWIFPKNIGTEYSNRIKTLIPLYKTKCLLTLLFLIIAILSLKNKIWLFLSYPVLLSLMQSVFYVETRHRMLIEPF